MKIMRQRKPSMKTIMGVTKAKRKIASATGIPTTKAGRQRKAKNTATFGMYGEYQRTRAKIHRPINTIKHPPTPMGCCLPVLIMGVLAVLTILGLVVLL